MDVRGQLLPCAASWRDGDSRVNATAQLSFYSRSAHGTRKSTDRSAGGGLVPSREIAGVSSQKVRRLKLSAARSGRVLLRPWRTPWQLSKRRSSGAQARDGGRAATQRQV